MSTLASIHQRDDRASQPAATAVPIGTLYYVTDEQVTERSNGSAWEDYSDAGTGGGGGGSGVVVQVVNTQTGAVATGTTVIPLGDTIPQITEGTEFMTRTITPTSATNLLQIEVVVFGTIATAARWLIAALFTDAVANAVAAFANFQATVSGGNSVVFTHTMVAGTTSAITFRVRAGCDAAGGTVTFNGVAGARIFGGVMASSITISEIVP
jgi:hypothetical protein